MKKAKLTPGMALTNTPITGTDGTSINVGTRLVCISPAAAAAAAEPPFDRSSNEALAVLKGHLPVSIALLLLLTPSTASLVRVENAADLSITIWLLLLFER